MKSPLPFRMCRWCGSCCLGFFCWLLWLLLLVSLGALAYIATTNELPVPAFVLQKLESRLAASGVQARIGRATLDRAGQIVLENVSLSAPAFDGPILTARALSVHCEPWALLAGNFEPVNARLAGVSFYVPALLSPTGASEPLVRDLDATFSLHGRLLEISQLNFDLAGLRVTARGGLRLPAGAAAGPRALPLASLLSAHYLPLARQLARLAERLRAFDTPALDLVLTPSETRGALVDLAFSANGLRLAPDDFSALGWHGAAPPGIEASGLHAATTLPLYGREPFYLRVQAAADRLAWPGRAEAAPLDAVFTAYLDPAARVFTPRTLDLSLGRIAALGELAAPFAAHLDFDAPGSRLAAVADVRLSGSPLHLTATADLRARTAQVALSGRLAPNLLYRTAQRHGRNLAPFLILGEQPTLRLDADFGPDWKFVRAGGWLRAHDVDAHNVPLDTVSARLDFSGHTLRATDIQLVQGDNLALGSYTMDTATRGYRFLLHGRLRPHGIDGWFKDWWPDFWDNFDFTRAAPSADVDIAGRWGDPALSHVFCYVDAPDIAVHGVAFDRIRTRLFVRPDFFDVFEFIGERDGRTARGSFTANCDVNSDELSVLDFNVASDLDLGASERIFGDDAINLLAPYQFAQPPQLRLRGHASSLASSAAAGPHYAIDLAIASTGGFAFYGFPVDDLLLSGRLTDTGNTFDRISARYAGGIITAQARTFTNAAGPRVSFSGRLDGADFARSIRTYAGYEIAHDPSSTLKKSKFLHQGGGGSLNATIALEGRPGDLLSFHGKGTAEIAGAQLGEINLLGLLSELLRHTLLSFTSLTLDTVHTSFDVQGPEVSFPYLKLTGPSAVIDATGRYSLADLKLNFDATIYPFERSDFLPANVLNLVLSPLSRALKVRLSGTLNDPDWVFVYGPSNFLRNLLNAPPPSPAAGPVAAAPPSLLKK